MLGLHRIKPVIALAVSTGILSACMLISKSNMVTYTKTQLEMALNRIFKVGIINYTYYTQENLVKMFGDPQDIVTNSTEQVLQYPNYSFTLHNNQLAAVTYQNNSQGHALFGTPCKDKASFSVVFPDDKQYARSNFQCIRSPFLDLLVMELNFQNLRNEQTAFTNVATVNYRRYNPLILDPVKILNYYQHTIQVANIDRLTETAFTSEITTIGKNSCHVFYKTGKDYQAKNHSSHPYLLMDIVSIVCFPNTPANNVITTMEYSNRYAPIIKDQINTKSEALQSFATLTILNMPEQ